MGAHNNWTAKLAQRRQAAAGAGAGDVDEAPAETFAELRARAKAAGVSAAGTRAEILERLGEAD